MLAPVFHLCLAVLLAWHNAKAASFFLRGFSFSAISNRIITPNGDGKNDAVVFSFENPQFSDVTGRVFDLRGALVETMSTGPNPSSTLSWNGKSQGRPVSSGIYIYVIEAESKLYKGAVMVIK